MRPRQATLRRKQNSPFVSALAKRLGQPHLEVQHLFGFVRDDVLTATRRKQEPFVYGSLGGDEYYVKLQ